MPIIDAKSALERLKLGNERFVSGQRRIDGLLGHSMIPGSNKAQEPFAVILGCSDSRVPAELVFDQGLGDLFVIRVAGNIVAPSQVGSVEFAISKLHTRLVVVLGHSECGAVEATIDELQHPSHYSDNIQSIVKRIRPVVAGLLETDLRNKPDELMHQAVRANVRASVNHLRQGSEVIERMMEEEGVMVVGAEYSLSTGVVEFFDGVPE